MMKPVCESHEMCPLMGKRLDKVCHNCAWYSRYRGKHPQTGEEIDKWDCAIGMLPFLLIDQTKHVYNLVDTVDAMAKQQKQDNDRALQTNLLRLGTLLQVAKK